MLKSTNDVANEVMDGPESSIDRPISNHTKRINLSV